MSYVLTYFVSCGKLCGVPFQAVPRCGESEVAEILTSMSDAVMSRSDTSRSLGARMHWSPSTRLNSMMRRPQFLRALFAWLTQRCPSEAVRSVMEQQPNWKVEVGACARPRRPHVNAYNRVSIVGAREMMLHDLSASSSPVCVDNMEGNLQNSAHVKRLCVNCFQSGWHAPKMSQTDGGPYKPAFGGCAI